MAKDSVDSLKFKPLPVEVKLTEQQKEAVKKDQRAIFQIVKENQNVQFEKPVNVINVTDEERKLIKEDPAKVFEILKNKQNNEFKKL